jgi:hypothetical protein
MGVIKDNRQLRLFFKLSENVLKESCLFIAFPQTLLLEIILKRGIMGLWQRVGAPGYQKILCQI